MTTYTLKNFIALILGIKKDTIEIENGSNIDFHMIEGDKIVLGFSPRTSVKKQTSSLLDDLTQLIKNDEDLGDYEVLLGNVETEEFYKIEMIDTTEDSIILGAENKYTTTKNPHNKWYFSDKLNALAFDNEKFHIIINLETEDEDSVGLSLFARSKSGNVSENKFTYFGSNEALINRFDFEAFHSFSPEASLLDVVKNRQMFAELED